MKFLDKFKIIYYIYISIKKEIGNMSYDEEKSKLVNKIGSYKRMPPKCSLTKDCHSLQ